ncbi:MAG: hypothetical protein A3I05_02820 [Deltaproteobacteria bacterium RIFCSPLOWO2_02_FULL_44_10]|nr:MAG: hypothetical protein A3C46_03480 [Deltaproteobacteria bacterium RIFCSPHIGHO2_02_FULL_44_16]OGQ46547.1 MAG: hypothetical protein A3I05_02820 [Deltaproteobacteria bacterium RIFCSPLOWO2_02_FULL_44_10]
MIPGTLFQYTDPREILVQIFQDKKERNPAYSIRAWARQLGFKTPSYLSDVLRGKTPLKPELALKIARILDVPEDERRYFETLVFHASASSDGEREFYEATLKKYRPDEQIKEFSNDFFDRAKSWVYWLTDEMIFLKDFRENYAYLAKRIGDDVTPQMVEIAMKEEEEIGLLQRNNKGEIIRKERYWVPLRDTVRKQNIYHEKVRRKFAERAVDACTSQPPEETFFLSSARPIRKKDIPKIKEFLMQMIRDLTQEFQPKQGDADEVFAVDVSFFRLTLGEPEK